LRASLIICICCLLVYNANGRAISAGDALPARYLPFAIWEHHTLLLDPVESLVLQGREPRANDSRPQPHPAYWTVTRPNGHLVSLYPVVLPVTIAPLYLPAVAYVHWQGRTDERVDHIARIMEKFSASLMAALSASLLYLLLRRRATPRIALLLTVAYAFGTTTWMISSQALWQHGLAQLLLVGLLLFLTAPCTVTTALAAGVLCGLIAGERPPDTILAAGLGAYGLFWAGRRAPLFVLAAALPAGLVLLYNLTVPGSIGGAYALVGKMSFFGFDMRTGLAGLLVSPTRGLFVFSPFLLFLCFAWRHRPRDHADRGLAIAILVGVALQILLYSAIDWRGGKAWGPRFLTDLLPLLIWLLVPTVAALRGVGRACFMAAVAVAIAIEAVGAFTYTGVSDGPILEVTSGPDRFRAAWDWRNAPFVASLSHGFAPAELTMVRRGAIDSIEAGGRVVDSVVSGDDVVVTGWALAGLATPWQVAVGIDGAPAIGTGAFFDRPDVRAALPGAGRAGWRVPLRTAGLAPGTHWLNLHVWASAEGENYFITRRALTVQAPPAASVDLGASFKTAVARIRAHQHESGYWLTAFTRTTRFEDPHPEMNTYLTSVLVDLLDPLTGATGLGDSVQRARQHLTAQIEADGLVRYHGLPNGPGIGTLGCAITPDTDDTALVWRIAPGRDRTRLPSALTTLERYRRDDGLYRTWLSPREGYQCIDPGRDPNPADIAIQIHLLQLLATAQPPAGRALCDALRRHIDEDDIWVYYRRTPLVPILRLTDLQRAGCSLDLPESRMQTTVPGQEIWLSVVRVLAHKPAPGAAQGVSDVDGLLRRLASDDFALLRSTPPLLYHNDLTASVPRYYWSEDVAYALWLRLAYDAAHAGHSKPGA